jgi:hypothetical protein
MGSPDVRTGSAGLGAVRCSAPWGSQCLLHPPFFFVGSFLLSSLILRLLPRPARHVDADWVLNSPAQPGTFMVSGSLRQRIRAFVDPLLSSSVFGKTSGFRFHSFDPMVW